MLDSYSYSSLVFEFQQSVAYFLLLKGRPFEVLFPVSCLQFIRVKQDLFNGYRYIWCLFSSYLLECQCAIWYNVLLSHYVMIFHVMLSWFILENNQTTRVVSSSSCLQLFLFPFIVHNLTLVFDVDRHIQVLESSRSFFLFRSGCSNLLLVISEVSVALISGCFWLDHGVIMLYSWACRLFVFFFGSFRANFEPRK